MTDEATFKNLIDRVLACQKLKIKMKSILKSILNKQQRHDLCLWRDRWASRVDAFFGSLVNLLPCRLKVFLKAHIQVKKRMDYARVPIFIDVSSSMENNVRTRSCAKEPETISWIERDFRPGDVMWDIGANVGAYSLVAAKYFKGKVKVYAIEPSFLNFSQLCRNIALNVCGDVVTPLNIALSEKTCVGRFNYQNFMTGGALHSFGEAVDFKNEVFEPVFRQDILSFSIDDLIHIFGLPVPDHIKLDVDGLETAIMKGAEKTLSNKKVRSILVELGDRDVPLVEQLKRHGFVVRERHPAGHGDLHLFNCILSR